MFIYKAGANAVDVVVGTTKVVGGTNGSVLFNNNGVLGEDNANFFWDETNKRLGLGTSSPSGLLSIKGTASINGYTVFTFANSNGGTLIGGQGDGRVWIGGNNGDNALLTINRSGAFQGGNLAQFNDGSNSISFVSGARIDASGNTLSFNTNAGANSNVILLSGSHIGISAPLFGVQSKLTVNPNTTADSSAVVQINTVNTTDKGLVLQGVSSQSGDLLELQTSGGGKLSFFDANGLLNLGLQGTQTGIAKFNGTTSGTVTLSVVDAAGTWTMKLPTTAGTNKYALTTDGSGNTSWNQIDLTAAVTGALPLANGGTGSSTPLGIPMIVGNARMTALTAAQALTTYTVGASDATYIVSANVLVTASVTHSFTVTCSYTDESNTARVLTLNFSQLTGAFITAITNVTGASAYEGVPVQIRAKAGTTIIIQSAAGGTYTSVTYNLEERIVQM